MALQPNYPMVNLGYLYIQGGQLTYSTTTTFAVAAGQYRDSTNINDIVIPATTVSILHTGLNGLDTGVVAASTTYYLYAIGSSVYGANDGQDENASQAVGPFPGTNINAGNIPPVPVIPYTAFPSYPDDYLPAGYLLSTTLGRPALPSGYDMYRRIGSIVTTAGSLITPFVMSGVGLARTVMFQTPVAIPGSPVAGSVAYATIGPLLNIVPQAIENVIVNCSLIPNAAGDVLYLAPYGNAAGGYAASMSAPVVVIATVGQLVCPTAFNAAVPSVVEIDYRTTSAADTVAFTIAGYVEAL